LMRQVLDLGGPDRRVLHSADGRAPPDGHRSVHSLRKPLRQPGSRWRRRVPIVTRLNHHPSPLPTLPLRRPCPEPSNVWFPLSSPVGGYFANRVVGIERIYMRRKQLFVAVTHDRRVYFVLYRTVLYTRTATTLGDLLPCKRRYICSRRRFSASSRALGSMSAEPYKGLATLMVSADPWPRCVFTFLACRSPGVTHPGASFPGCRAGVCICGRGNHGNVPKGSPYGSSRKGRGDESTASFFIHATHSAPLPRPSRQGLEAHSLPAC